MRCLVAVGWEARGVRPFDSHGVLADQTTKPTLFPYYMQAGGVYICLVRRIILIRLRANRVEVNR